MDKIISVWGDLADYIVSLFPKVVGFFVDTTTGALTLPGQMAVIMAGVSLLLLCFNLIRSFLPMRG